MSDNTPTTTFAGESNPHKKKNYSWGLSLIFVLVAPVAVITALMVYFLFSVVRIHYKVIGAFVAFYAVGLVVSGQIAHVAQMYLSSFIKIFPYIKEQEWGNLAFVLFINQLPLSLLIGGIIGYIASWWGYKRRPVWIETNFRRTPIQLIRRWRNIQNIKNDKKTPLDGRTLGVNYEGDRVVQTEEESAAHTLLVGGAGTGKTTTLVTGARDIIKRGEGLALVDMKGSSDLPEILAKYCKRYNRKFYHWIMQNPDKQYEGPAKLGPAYYDPLRRGDATRKADLLISLREWTEDYYKGGTKSYLQNALIVANANPEKDQRIDSLQEAMLLLDAQYLKKRCLPLVGNPKYEHIITTIYQSLDGNDAKETKKILGSMRDQLALLRNSTPGQWLRKDPKGQQDINLFDIAHNGDVVLFTVDSATYEDTAKDIGNLIIQDLKTVAGELMNDKSRYPFNVFIDEFSAIGSDSIANLLARCREAKVPVTLSTQSLGDLREISEAFLDKLTGIVAGFLLHRANSLKDAEIYAGFGGQGKKKVFRQSVEMTSGLFGGIGKGSSTGSGSIDEVVDYLIDPSDIQNLGTGELIFIANAPSKRIEYVTVIKENDMHISNENDNASSPEDADWVASGDEYVIPMDEEDVERYTIDPTINAPYENPMEQIYGEIQEHPSNKEALKRIFNNKEVYTKESEEQRLRLEKDNDSHQNTKVINNENYQKPKTSAPTASQRTNQPLPKPTNTPLEKPKLATPKRPTLPISNQNRSVPPRPAQNMPPKPVKRPSAPPLPPRRPNVLPKPPKPSEDGTEYITDW